MPNRAVQARRIVLNDPEVGPKYLRLSGPSRRVVDNLFESGRYADARREILRQDDIRRLRRRLREEDQATEKAVDHVMSLFGFRANEDRVRDNLSYATRAELRAIPLMTVLQYAQKARQAPKEFATGPVNPFWYR